MKTGNESADWRLALIVEHDRLHRMIKERMRDANESWHDAFDAVIDAFMAGDDNTRIH